MICDSTLLCTIHSTSINAEKYERKRGKHVGKKEDNNKEENMSYVLCTNTDKHVRILGPYIHICSHTSLILCNIILQ